MKLPETDWNTISSARSALYGSAIRFSLLFGSIAVALALFLAPMAERYSRTQIARSSDGIDMMSTGSIGTAAKRDGYTIRRSVLQTSPNSVCIIAANGQRSGDC